VLIFSFERVLKNVNLLKRLKATGHNRQLSVQWKKKTEQLRVVYR